jgi:D-glycerate 3-kinase
MKQEDRMTITWQETVLRDINTDHWQDLKQKLMASLDPAIHQPGLVERYYLPLFFHLYQQRTASGQPGFIAGINAPQGGGKSTLTSYLVKLFDWSGLRAVTLSIDDFYLTREQQVRLAADFPDNPYLQQRGYPGTHDIELGANILTRLKQPDTGSRLLLPRYDKSQHQGQGDRAIESVWPEIELPVDIVLVEGWMLGFQPVSAGLITDPHLQQINTLLGQYSAWHSLLDSFVYIRPDDPAYVLEWRSEAEERMKAKGLPGMTASEVRAYAEKFLPEYQLYGPQLTRNPLPGHAFLQIDIGKNRLPL